MPKIKIPELQNIKDSEFIFELPIKGIYEIKRPRREDNRGYFQEVVVFPEIEKLTGVNFSEGQWNESLSFANVIRAIHAESQAKLVRPVTGKIFIAFVDFRPESETFGDHVTLEYDALQDSRVFFLPKGIGNSICVVGDSPVKYEYVVSTTYNPNDKPLTIKYNDLDIGIQWPIKEPIISTRDLDAQTLRDSFPQKFKND